MGAAGDREAVVGGGPGVGFIAGLLKSVLVLLVPDVGETLEEEQWEDVLLVVAGIDQAPQELRCTPQVSLELLLTNVFGGLRKSPDRPRPGKRQQKGDPYTRGNRRRENTSLRACRARVL